MTDDNSFGPKLICGNCKSLSFNDFKYCSSCGAKKEAVELTRKVEITADKNFISLLTYFFVTVGILAFTNFSEFYSDDEFNYVIILILLALIDLVFAFVNGKPSFLFSTKGFKFNILVKALGVLTLGALLVHFLADFLNASIFNDYVDEIYLTGENWWLVILLFSVYPAFFEEISFRGFLFHNVEAISNKRAAVIVTSVIFGITHLSFVSLIWHIPLGYYFATLRAKYNTLWYGVIGHFYYNTLVTMIDTVI